MTTYSVSRVNTFLECPWKHWCKYVAGYKAKVNPEQTQYMDRGTVFHTGMEIMADHNGELSEAQLLHLTASAHENSDFLDSAKESGMLAISRYLEQKDIVDFSKVIHTELELRYTLPNGHEYIGYVDAVVQNDDGTVSLIDYKTYSESPVAEKLVYSMQGNMYMEVMTRMGYKVKDMSFECINPKAKLTKRNYVYKPVKFNYNKYRGEDMFEQFVELTSMLERNVNLRTYVPTTHKPDVYDYFYKVYVGDVTEDLDEYIEKNFKKVQENS